MASAWGFSWGAAWGGSWGSTAPAVVADPGGGGRLRRKRKRDEDPRTIYEPLTQRDVDGLFPPADRASSLATAAPSRTLAPEVLAAFLTFLDADE